VTLVITFVVSRILLLLTKGLSDNFARIHTQALLSAAPVPDRAVEARRRRTLLQGEVPSPLNPPSGCRLHPRCPLAQSRCAAEEPRMREIRPGHYAACHFAE
jgi:oligopeptide/dipeptide ABC transporter ATP-binding protein